MPTHFANLSKWDELMHVVLSELAQAQDPAPAPVPEPPPTPASGVPAFPDLDTHRERRKLAHTLLRIRHLEQPHRKRQKRQKAAAQQKPAAPQASQAQGPRLRSFNTPKRSRSVPSVKKQPSHAHAISGHMLLGKFVLKAFSGQMYRGRVTRVSTATGTAVYEFRPGLTSDVKCLVRYEDGDSEHMTPDEVERLLDPSKLCT